MKDSFKHEQKSFAFLKKNIYLFMAIRLVES